LSRVFAGVIVALVADHDEAAPGELELVRAFVNTRDLQRSDGVATPPQLRAWLVEHGLAPASLSVNDEELGRAHATREALRELAEANCGIPVPPTALATLDDAARRVPLHLAFVDAGTVRLEPRGAGVDAALGRLLAIVQGAVERGEWSRLKACRDPTCRWLYYDHSKNRSAAWCSMATCGNRNKARRRRAVSKS
jgi:predicted RNA-binding Zn ribbon-like protein